MKNFLTSNLLLLVGLLTGLFTPQEIAAQIPATTAIFPEGKHVVEVPFKRYRGWIIVEVEVNQQQSLSFILDTGAPVAVIANPDLAETLQLNIVGQAMVQGGDGQPPKSAPLAMGGRFKIGDLVIENGAVVLGVAGDAIYGVDGVIGKYLFDHAVVKVDWLNSRLILTKPDQFNYEGQGEIIPFEVAASGHIFCEIDVSLGGKKKNLKAAIDTGNRSNFKLSQWARAEIDAEHPIIENTITGWGANGPSYSALTRVDLSVGPIRFFDVVTGLGNDENGPLEKAGILANIGLSILERFDLIFDYARQQLILEKNDHFADEFTYSRSGIIIHPRHGSDHLVVVNLIPNSPGLEAGFQEADKIIKINGKDINQYEVDEIDQILAGKEHDQIELVVARGDQVFSKAIKMKKII